MLSINQCFTELVCYLNKVNNSYFIYSKYNLCVSDVYDDGDDGGGGDGDVGVVIFFSYSANANK